MNHSLIAQEIRSLRESIDRQITKSLPYDKRANNNQSVKDFSFSDSFFQVDSRGQERTVSENKKEPAVVKDTDTATQESLKDTTIKDIKETKILDTKKAHNVPEKDIKHGRETKITQPRTKTSAPKTNATKDLRHENILKILKQKRDASINDICALFKDCSSKTIQRDLSDLIEKNLVVKKGLRRWSTYNLAY